MANALRIQEKVGAFDLEQLLDVMTFEVIEQKIIVDLASHIPAATKAELEHFRTIISTRLMAIGRPNIRTMQPP